MDGQIPNGMTFVSLGRELLLLAGACAYVLGIGAPLMDIILASESPKSTIAIRSFLGNEMKSKVRRKWKCAAKNSAGGGNRTSS